MYQVAIFIDGGYLDKVLQYELGNMKLDYAAFSGAIASTIHTDTDILRTYYYHCLPIKGSPPTPTENDRFAAMENFLDALGRLPRFQVCLGKLVRRNVGEGAKPVYEYEQKQIDTLLSINLVHACLKGKITHVALVAGDSDFIPAIEVARQESMSVWLFHGQRPHQDLWRLADERIPLDKQFVRNLHWKS